MNVDGRTYEIEDPGDVYDDGLGFDDDVDDDDDYRDDEDDFELYSTDDDD